MNNIYDEKKHPNKLNKKEPPMSYPCRAIAPKTVRLAQDALTALVIKPDAGSGRKWHQCSRASLSHSPPQFITQRKPVDSRTERPEATGNISTQPKTRLLRIDEPLPAGGAALTESGWIKPCWMDIGSPSV